MHKFSPSGMVMRLATYMGKGIRRNVKKEKVIALVYRIKTA